MRTNPMERAVAGNHPVVTDGGWATEFQKRGLPLGVVPDEWNLSQPNVVMEVAQAYVDAGSQIILTNTFQSNPISMQAMGNEARCHDWNRTGAELSRRAAGNRAHVFGAVGPTGLKLSASPSQNERVMHAFRVQVEALAEGGVEAIVFETFSDLVEAQLALTAASRLGLPRILCFAFDAIRPDGLTLSGVSPEQAGQVARDWGASAVGANCGIGPTSFIPLCQRLAQFGLPVWMKPNAGLPVLRDQRSVYDMDPETFASQMMAMVNAGASYIGGCCGTNPRFIQAIVRQLHARDDCKQDTGTQELPQKSGSIESKKSIS